MEQFDIPLFKKLYDLYRNMHGFRNAMPKQDRHTVWQKCESVLLNILEEVLLASQLPKAEKLPLIDKASSDLNSLRIFFRLSLEIKAIDNKKYLTLQSGTDEIGRMLGGWMKSVKEIQNKQ
jgi:hypothetical protein